MAPKRRGAALAAPPANEPAVMPEEAAPAAKRAKASRGKKAGAAAAPAAAAGASEAPEQGQGQRGQQFYLMKSEPDVFSIDDLAAKEGQTEHWDGVRSHQAKKVMQGMREGDHAFFYHSNAKPPGVVGIVEIVREAYPDHTQFDSSSEYHDASSKPDAPKWFMVDCRLVRRLSRQISLEELKRHAGVDGPLRDMALFKYGRLSVQPVTRSEWEYVLGLEAAEAGGGAGKQSGDGAKAGAGRQGGSKKGGGGGKKGGGG